MQPEIDTELQLLKIIARENSSTYTIFFPINAKTTYSQAGFCKAHKIMFRDCIMHQSIPGWNNANKGCTYQQMPNPQDAQNWLMPHPQDRQGRQMPCSCPGGGRAMGVPGID